MRVRQAGDGGEDEHDGQGGFGAGSGSGARWGMPRVGRHMRAPAGQGSAQDRAAVRVGSGAPRACSCRTASCGYRLIASVITDSALSASTCARASEDAGAGEGWGADSVGGSSSGSYGATACLVGRAQTPQSADCELLDHGIVAVCAHRLHQRTRAARGQHRGRGLRCAGSLASRCDRDASPSLQQRTSKRDVPGRGRGRG